MIVHKNRIKRYLIRITRIHESVTDKGVNDAVGNRADCAASKAAVKHVIHGSPVEFVRPGPPGNRVAFGEYSLGNLFSFVFCHLKTFRIVIMFKIERKRT